MKDTFTVEYTGLKRTIGNPQDYSKNVEKGEEFFRKALNTVDVSFTINETDQGINRKSDNDFDDLSGVLDDDHTDLN